MTNERITGERLAVADALEEFAMIDEAEGGNPLVIATERRAAELLRASEPGVKGLEWGEDKCATTPFGTYSVTEGSDDRWRFTFHCYPYGTESDEAFKLPSEAKAAAQADYERRILSAIDHVPAQGGSGEVEELIEQLLDAQNCITPAGRAALGASHDE